MGQEDQGLARSEDRYRAIPRTLAFITHGDDVLLLRGAPHKRLWAGRYNGVGGHVEQGEDIYTAALREIKEETALEVHDLRLRAVIHIDAGGVKTGIMIFVFTAVAADRDFQASAEGALAWVPQANLPLAEAVEDLPALLPRVLAMGPDDPPLFAAYSYDAGNRLQVRFADAR